MLHDPTSLDLALAAPGAPTLDIVGARVEVAALSAMRRRDLLSALRRVAGALGYEMWRIPADPIWLRPRIIKLSPAAIGVSSKTWTNILSDFRAALRVAGVSAIPVTGSAAALPPSWAALHAGLTCRRSRIGLQRFMRFCANLEIAPDQVDDAILAAFRDAVASSELRKDPNALARTVAVLWNLAVAGVAGWPARRLTVADRRVRVCLPPETFEASLIADLEDYLGGLQAPDITDVDAPAAPLAPRSIESLRRTIFAFASALVRAGRDPASLRSLGDLVEPATVRAGLRALMAKAGGRPRPSDARTALVLKSMAKWRVKVAPDVLDELSGIVRRMAPRQARGMTPANRDRLRQFDDPGAIAALASLPARLEKKALRARDPKRAARLMEMAVAIALLLHCPMRISNLRRLDLDRHLIGRPGKPRRIVIPTDEVKNHRELDYPLTSEVAALIERYARTHRLALNPAAGALLFSQRRAATPVDRGALGKAISKTILSETGLRVHPHFFRHLAAKIVLRAQPGAYEAVRRLLAHSQTSATIDAYAGFETDAAAQAYARILDDAARAAPARRRRA